MRKLRLVSIVLILITQVANCQPSVLGEESKGVEFSDIVVADSLSKELLFQNAQEYVRLLKNDDEKFELQLKDSITGKLCGQSTFFVYSSQSGILKKISGAISYYLSIEVKENKYRYRFNDFSFHYYKQDRYFNIVETGKVKNLGDSQASGWQRLWMRHKSLVYVKMQNQIKNLKIKMLEKHKKDKEKRAKIEW